MTDINAARSVELSTSVYFDAEAPADLVAHVRGVLAATAPSVRMTLSYLDGSFVPHAGDDMAVIVAGPSKGIGAAAAAVRAAGVPVAVVTLQPTQVDQQAQAIGYAIPDGDLLAPQAADGEGEPLQLTDERASELDERLGRWIVAVCHEKRLAMALAFPFMRRSLAKDAVQATSVQNAGIGLVPIIAGAELPIMTLNQAKMVLQIAAAYGQEMDKNRIKELAAVVGGAYLCRGVARKLVGLVPVLGVVVKPGIAYGGTAAIGNAAIEYFEGGQDAAGVVNVATQASKKGTQIAEKLRTEGVSAIPSLFHKTRSVKDYVPIVQSKVHEYAPKVVAVVDDLADYVTQTK